MYYHDRGDLQELLTNKQTRFYEPDGSRSWRWGLPPLHYPTHAMDFWSASPASGSARFRRWAGATSILTSAITSITIPFSTSAALMETNRGHMSRCNVFWLVGEGGERAQWYGDKGSLYMANRRPAWRHLAGPAGRVASRQALRSIPITLRIRCCPAAMRHKSGHGGSQVFLSAEFINALVEDREPAVDVYKALAMTVPGIVGHQSALKQGRDG